VTLRCSVVWIQPLRSALTNFTILHTTQTVSYVHSFSSYDTP